MMVEKIIYENSGRYSKMQLWEKLPKKMMYQTYSLIIEYLLLSGKISFEERKIVWIGIGKDDNKFDLIKKKIVDVLRNYGIKKAGIFGSYAKGEENKDSDIDILVEPKKGMGLEFVEMAFELERAIGKKVDLVTYSSINKLIRKRVLSEEVRII